MRPYNDGASVFASRCAIIILAKGGGAVSDDIKSDNPFDLAHYAGMQAWKQRGSDTRKLDYMKLAACRVGQTWLEPRGENGASLVHRRRHAY